MLNLPFTAFHGCVLADAGVEEALCRGGSVGQPVSSHISAGYARPVNRRPVTPGLDLLFGFAPSLFQGGLLLVDL